MFWKICGDQDKNCTQCTIEPSTFTANSHVHVAQRQRARSLKTDLSNNARPVLTMHAFQQWLVGRRTHGECLKCTVTWFMIIPLWNNQLLLSQIRIKIINDPNQ